MNKRKIFSVVVALFMLIAFSAAMGFAEGQKEAKPKVESDPDTLVYAAMSQERAPVVAERMEGLLEYVAEVTGKKTEIYLTTSYAAQIEAMLGGFAHIANFGPFAYVKATERDPNIEAFATYVVESMPEYFVPGGPKYVGMLVTKKGSQYTSIDSLKGEDVAFSDPGSTSGWLVPNVLFTKRELGGSSLDDYFGELIFAGSHDAAILAVLEERVSAAFTWDSAPYRLWKRGEMGRPDKELNVLWTSPDIPLDPYSYRTELNDDLKAKIRKAFLTWHEKPESKKFFESIGATKFVEMQDSDYDVTRELAEAMKEAE
ncbi:MAG: phosphate/phosphite/phosphonate ABC transporter substrate-binding protein [Spirochaetota bacterium]